MAIVEFDPEYDRISMEQSVGSGFDVKVSFDIYEIFDNLGYEECEDIIINSFEYMGDESKESILQKIYDKYDYLFPEQKS